MWHGSRTLDCEARNVAKWAFYTDALHIVHLFVYVCMYVCGICRCICEMGACVRRFGLLMILLSIASSLWITVCSWYGMWSVRNEMLVCYAIYVHSASKRYARRLISWGRPSKPGVSEVMNVRNGRASGNGTTEARDNGTIVKPLFCRMT